MLRQLFEYHPVIGYRFIPDLKTRVSHESGGYLVRVNNLGFRCNHDFVTGKKTGIRRILLFGDSFTAGDGVSNEHRYGDLLEKMVPNLEVYNFGLPGSGLDQNYLAYKEYATSIEHDLLVIAVFIPSTNRIALTHRPWQNEKGETVYYAKPYYELVDNKLVLKNAPPRREPIVELDSPEEQKPVGFDRLTSRMIGMAKTLVRALVRKMPNYQPTPEYNSSDNPVWRIMRAILEEWISNNSKPVLLLPVPFYQHIEGPNRTYRYQARFREVASATGCIIYDPLPDLMKYSRKERKHFRFQRDPHFTPEGHTALAGCLAPVLQDLLDSLEQRVNK